MKKSLFEIIVVYKIVNIFPLLNQLNQKNYGTGNEVMWGDVNNE